MNIKLHNKYEIILGDKTYVAYNTITHNIFDAISNFVQYSKYIIFGRGTKIIDYNSDYMEGGIIWKESELEELQCDPSKGVMFARRTASVPKENFSFSFSQVAITHQNNTGSEPVVYSHTFVRDENGEILEVQKDFDTELLVRYTIYLEIENPTVLTPGENDFVKAMLGELDHVPVVSLVRGQNTTPNGEFVSRHIPANATKHECEKTLSKEQSPSITYAFDIKSGETLELVLLFDDNPVARVNTLESAKKFSDYGNFTSQTNYTLDLVEYLAYIEAIQDLDGNEITGYHSRAYAKDFLDFLTDPFDADFTSSCARWVSKDGNKLAYVANDTVYIYLNKNYGLTKISNNITASGLTKIVMFENYIFAFYKNKSLVLYKIENSCAVEIGFDKTQYEVFDESYDWQDFEVISNANGDFLIGVILGEINRNAVLIYAKMQDNVLTVSSVEYGKSDYVVNMFALYHNNFCDSMIGFITNNYNLTADNYRIEQRYVDGTYEVTNELPAYYLTNGTVSLEGKSRAVIAKKTEAPYIWLFYYPQVYRYSISLTEGVENWISTNLMYLIQKYGGATPTYKIYSLNDYDNPQEFINGLPSSIDQSTIEDFEFLDDILIIFTTQGTYAINLKLSYTVVENLPAANTTYYVQFGKSEPIGTQETEGVIGSFKVEFKIWCFLANLQSLARQKK